MLDAKKENLQSIDEDVKKIDSDTVSENKNQKEVEITSSISDTKIEEEVKPEKEDVVEDTEPSGKVDDSSEDTESSEKGDNSLEEVLLGIANMSLESLVAELQKQLKDFPIQKINKQVNAIKSSFNAQFAKLLAEKKAVFLAEGGDSIDFKYSNPLKVEYNSLMNDFKDKRTKYYKNLESELSDNLELRLSLIEQLKDLIDNAEPQTMYKKFQDLQDRWRKTGPVAREKYNNTWRTYHHHVERFYDLLHLSNDFRELDFKHNLEEKLKLVAKVELLAENKDVNDSFKQLQELHRMWKEDVGPVAREFRDEVWNKFSAATNKIHDKRHDYYKDLKGKYLENVENKLAIIQKIDEIDTSKNKTHSDWQQSIKVIESLREQFFKAGKVPKSENEKIWIKFKDATKKFNKEKNIFYKSIKSVQQDNLQNKIKLIELAESFKDSEEWETVTEAMKKIQSDWKKTGHVPRKYSDEIWTRFKSACNHYFDRYHAYQNDGSNEEQEIYGNKKSFLEKIKEDTSGVENLDLDTVKGYIENWRSMGTVSYSMRHIESKFSKLLDKLFSQLSIDKIEIEVIKFENKMEALLAQKNLRKLDGEKLYLRKKIDESVREIQQLENNISFISNADANNPLLKNVISNISNHKENVTILKRKLSYLSKLDY